MGTTHAEEDNRFDGLDSCHAHLHALVVYLEETAQLEGKGLLVKWRHDGSVLIHCIDFIQQMRCQNGQLHIDYSEPEVNPPEN